MIKTNKPKIFNISFCCSKEKSNSKEMKIKTENSLKFLQKKDFALAINQNAIKIIVNAFQKGKIAMKKYALVLIVKIK